jgi:hypothetical protein
VSTLRKIDMLSGVKMARQYRGPYLANMSSARKLADVFPLAATGHSRGSDCSEITLPHPFIYKSLTLFLRRG